MPQKICPRCNTGVGVRTKQCSCGFRFRSVFNPNKGMMDVEDWTQLVKGDRIKSLQGYGPKRLCGDVEEYMGNYGEFTVISLDLQGIHAHGNEGHAYLYMGPDKTSVTGTLMRSHKLKKLPPKTR